MKILVTGGNFNNKGAQAMLMITMSELKKHYPDAKLIFDSQEANVDVGDYYFEHIDRDVLRTALAIKSGAYSAVKGLYEAAKHAVWAFRDHKYKEIFAEYKYLKMLEDLKIVIDISGYNLSSKFSMRHNLLYLDIIRYAGQCGMKVFLMPQSFGPFEYGDAKEQMTGVIKDAFAKTELVFAREQEGYDLMQGMGIRNLRLSCDLVLQNSEVNWSSIKKTPLKYGFDKLETKKNVLLVPNQKIFDHMKDDERLYRMYSKVMEKILSYGNDIYLVYHSNEDLKICRKLQADNVSDRIHIVEQELAFYEYERVVAQCRYALASRFHSIVLAYRQSVPCIALGWAEKYDNLLESCGQQKYVNSILDESMEDSILKCVEVMEENCQNEKQIIADKLGVIRQNYCFDEVFSSLME